MASVEDEDTRWVTRESRLSAGRTLYWLATIIAGLMLIFALAEFLIDWSQGHPVVRVVALIAAAVVWLIGRVCRSLAD